MYYKLVGRETVPCELMEWAESMRSPSPSCSADVGKYDSPDVVGHVSTVFLGLDHSYGGGRPMLFETMIFGGPHDQYQTRCSTYDEAEAMHELAIKVLNGEVKE